MADQGHFTECRIGLYPAELRHRLFNRLPQLQGRIRYRIPRAVREKPELEMVTYLRIFQKIIHHVRPSERAGSSAMHKNNRHMAILVRLKCYKLCPFLIKKRAVEKSLIFVGPGRGLREAKRTRG